MLGTADYPFITAMRATKKALIRRTISIITSVATVVGAIATMKGVATKGNNSPYREESGETQGGAALTSPKPVEGSDTPPMPSLTTQPATPDAPRVKKAGHTAVSLPPRHLMLPRPFTLRDGEQHTFLEDQASVAVDFNQIGSQDFVTLRLSITGSESVPYAVLDAGARLPVRVAGSDYSVYVLSVDKIARTVTVRISRDFSSQEKRGR